MGSAEDGGTSGEAALPYPKGAIFILAGYLTERFVYYGMFGGSVLYMQRVLGFSSASSTTIKAVLEGLIYLAPIAGAILADTYLGKVRTVLLMCCVYTVGAIIFSLSSITTIMQSAGLVQSVGIGGMLILGLSAGLMKAVYTSLGPDQFKLPEQRQEQRRYFYAFYWMINAGAFFGQLMTAQLRDSVQCFAQDCYFLPFGILCGFMVLSTIIFASGRSRYIEAPPDPMLVRAIKCVYHGIVCRLRKDRKPVDHWVDRARDIYDADLITDVKATLKVLVLFCTYPLFWALFYQSSTGMIFQAKRLHDRIGSYRVPPELTSSINPLLILMLIPLFDLVIYPLCDRKGILRKTTSRMITGMAFSAVSFIIYAILNMQVEQNILGEKVARLDIYNSKDCKAEIIYSLPVEMKLQILPNEQQIINNIHLNNTEESTVINISCGNITENVRVVLETEHVSTLILTVGKNIVLLPTLHYLKDIDAEAKVRIVDAKLSENGGDVTLRYKELNIPVPLLSGVAEFQKVSPQEYEVISSSGAVIGIADVRQDGVYDILIDEGKSKSFYVTEPTSIHVFSLIPQYLVLTIGEVLFSVSSIDFAYSEAPVAMKSVMQAANLLTITIGLWFYAAMTKTSVATGVFLHRPSFEAISYSVLMFINTFLFMWLIYRYNRNASEEPKLHNDLNNDPKDNTSIQTKTANGHDNPAFQDENSL